MRHKIPRKHSNDPAAYEFFIAVLIVAVILIPRLIGTSFVSDRSQGLDSAGYPANSVTLEDLNAPGTRFACMTVREWEDAISNRFPEGLVLQLNSLADGYAALEAGKADAALSFSDERQSLAQTHPDLAFIEEPFASQDFGFGVQKSSKGKLLCEELNQYLRDLKSNGTYEALEKKWKDPSRDGDVMGEYNYSGQKGILKIATSGQWTPMTFFYGDTLTGLFIEVLNGFCEKAGYIPMYETVPLAAELTGLSSGVYDIVANAVTISGERLESINITDPLMTDEFYLVVKGEDHTIQVPKATLFVDSLKASFRRTFVEENRYRILLAGLKVTILLALTAGIFGTLLGIVVCFLSMRSSPFIRAVASLYIRIFRTLPIVVLLLVLAYIVFRNSTLSSFWICVIAFSIEFSAYSSEIFRGGINAVPAGQARAATALGFGKLQTFGCVVLPQALVHIMPAYMGEFITTIKMTAIAGYISVVDLTKASDIIRSRTYEAFFPLILISIVYFIICILPVSMLRMIEKKTDPAYRRVKEDILGFVECYRSQREDSMEPAFIRSKEAGGIITEQSKGDGKGRVLLEVNNLKKSFDGVTPIRDVSCSICTQDVISIIGPSGTGKSTFLCLLNHLETPDGGTILFDGKNTAEKGYDYNRMRERIGMVFQSFNLFTHLTVVENLMLAQTRVLKRSRKYACQRSMELLDMAGMTDKALSLPAQLSGGQQQRVAILRAVATDPEILLLDEPTSALDPSRVGEVLAIIRRLADEGMTMMIVTHEMHFARNVSNRVFFMDKGVIYEEGTAQEIFENPQKELTRIFIKGLKIFEASVDSRDYDFTAFGLKLDAFLVQNDVQPHDKYRIRLAMEELMQQIILPRYERPFIRVKAEYSPDKQECLIFVDYKGERFDIKDTDNELSLSIFKNVVNDISYTFCENDEIPNHMEIRITHEQTAGKRQNIS